MKGFRKRLTTLFFDIGHGLEPKKIAPYIQSLVLGAKFGLQIFCLSIVV
jgi:hypothetical protein